jgi:hypothetical protein
LTLVTRSTAKCLITGMITIHLFLGKTSLPAGVFFWRAVRSGS